MPDSFVSSIFALNSRKRQTAREETKTGQNNSLGVPASFPFSTELLKKRKLDLSYLSFLLVLSATIHFTHLSRPSQVVFDEFYYGASVNNYMFTHKYDFIAHPPWGQLFCAYSAKLFGYSGKGVFDPIGHANDPRDMWALRMGPAILGTLFPLLFYGVLRLLGAIPIAGLLAAFAIIFDNGFLMQTRTIAQEGFLMTNLWGSVLLFLIANRQKKAGYRNMLLFAVGITAGNAFGTKFTGLSILPVLGMLSLKYHGWIWPHRKDRTFFGPIGDMLIAAVGFLLSLILGLYLHYRLLYNPGDAAKFFLIHHTFWGDSYRFVTAIFEANRTLKATHPSASMWWSWPFDYAAVYLWTDNNARMYYIGNPLLYFATTTLLLCYVSLAFFRKSGVIQINYAPSRQPQAEFLLMLAYAAAFLPHILISRVMFLYHYLPPLTFAMGLGVFWLQSLGWFRDGGITQQRRSFYFLIFLLLLGFSVFIPITFGLQTTPDYFILLNKLWIRWT